MNEQYFSQFVGKFCFDYKRGNPAPDVGILDIKLTREGPAPKGTLNFMVFDDEHQHWKQIRKTWRTSTCQEKAAAASYVAPMIFTDKEETKMLLRINEQIRPRFWYMAFVGCGLESAAPVKFQVHATNDLWPWQKEFSLDHMNLIWLHGCFAVGFTIATAATWWKVMRPDIDTVIMRDHPYVKLLLLSYGASLASCVFFLLHYRAFMHDGHGSQRIRFLGVLAGIVANSTVFLISIMSSVGWAVTTYSLQDHRFFLGSIVLVGGFSAVVELHSDLYMEQETRLYSYQSPAGLIALMAKVLMFCWFSYQMVHTYTIEEQEKPRRYYKFLGVTFTTWSLNVPVVVILAFQLSPWVRYKVVTSVDVAFRFVGQALLAFSLLGPSSPISRENTFSSSPDMIGLEEMYSHLEPTKPTRR